MGELRQHWKTQGNPDHFDAVGVYLGSSYDDDNPVHRETAKEARLIGKGLAERKSTMVYGGGSYGLMGITSQAVLDAGGTIEGHLIPEFVQDEEYPQKPYDRVDPDINTRKNAMYDNSQAFIMLPGGIGTEEELWDVLGKQYLSTYSGETETHLKPVILVNIDGHYDLVKQRIDDLIDRGYASAEARQMIKIVPDGAAALAALDEYYEKGPEAIIGQIGNVQKKGKDGEKPRL